MERIFSKYDLFVELCNLYYRNIVKNEIRLANIRSYDKVLCIGGGFIPSTAIEIVRQTHAHVHVLDIDKKAIGCARNVIARLGLQDKITVINGKGQDIDIEPYDVVHIAQQVSPKDEVLNSIWEKAKEGHRIIVRMPRKILKPFYSNIADDFIKNNSKDISTYSIGCRAKSMEEILLMVKI
ncbi:MAG: class I SAM-dependent methyltransferase [Clostridiales bacterium]|nr:class I SAM-dependent methyltransferase [Clostridiales bacterium]